MRPSWATRIRAERDARGWSQRTAVRALRCHTTQGLPDEESLLRTWKRWEAGENLPDDFYQPLIAGTFGTVTQALFPAPQDRGDPDLLAATGMNTLEIVARMRATSVDNATLEALRVTADRLCSEYSYMPSAQLQLEGQQWLRRITGLLDHRMTLDQHREVLALAGLVALLVGCVEHDGGDRGSAEATRRSALSLGVESDDLNVVGWAHEMLSWFHLTSGNYRGVIAAAEAGTHAAGARNVSIQLAAQRAKAWARVGDRRQVELALEDGRRILEELPYPDNTAHHFVVDPAKFDFYAMDCYRVLGEDGLADAYAREVIRAGTDYDGQERSPMRNAEARVTLGVVAARQGNLDKAVMYGRQALTGKRQSLPSLLMCSRELGSMISDQSSRDPDAVEYIDQLHALGEGQRSTVR